MTLARKGEGVPNADATVNFACEMPHFADGWGSKMTKILRRHL